MKTKLKKVLAILLTAVMLVTMSVSALAASGSFVSSPSGNAAPTLVSFKPENADCNAELIITPYSEKNTLSDELRALIEKAYGDIVGSDDLTKLCSALASLASSKGIAGDKLAVSDLFDIHVEGCTAHEDHVNFNVTIAADTLDRFVGLLHMTENGTWELIESAKVSEDGKTLSFNAKTLSPFAIVVDTTEGGSNAGDNNNVKDDVVTGDNSHMGLYIGIFAVAAAALAVTFVVGKKKKA